MHSAPQSPATTARAPVLVDLADVPDGALRRFYDELLARAFPPSELLARSEFEAARRSGSVEGSVLLRGDEPVGGAVVEQCVGGRVLLLAYLVVSAAARSGGLGGQLLRTLPAHGRVARPLIVAEIEDPRCHAASPDRGDPVARLRFYQRAGARLLPLAYFQPSLRPGSPRVPGMLLIVLEPDGEDVEAALVGAFLDEYFAGCEGPEVLTGDPEVVALRAAAQGDAGGRLRLVELSDLDAARVVGVGGS